MDSPTISNANVPPDANTESGTGFVDKLAAFIDAMKNDPDDMAEGQLFMQYLQNLSADGLLQPGSQCEQLLQGLGNSGLQTLLNTLVMQNAAASYFGLYNGTMGNAGAMAWINSQMTTIESLQNQGHGNPVLSDMFTAFLTAKQNFAPIYPGTPPTSEFDSKHFNSKTNQYYWASSSVTDPFIWTPGSTLTGDDFTIYTQFASSGISQTPGPFWDNLNINEFDRSYRLQMFDLICKKYPNDPSIILTLFMLMISNNEFNGDLSGYTDQTDRQTYVTNQMSPITNLASEIGKLDQNDPAGSNPSAQADELAHEIDQITAIVNSMHSTEGYASTFTQNVYDTFWNMSVTFTPKGASAPVTATLQQVYLNEPVAGGAPGTGPFTDPSDFSLAVNSINPPPTPNSNGINPTNEGLQTIDNAMQQANALVSQQSKTISTLAASDSNTLDQILKIMNFATNTSAAGGGGFVSLEGQLVSNQISH